MMVGFLYIIFIGAGQKIAMHYTPGAYFGELALLKNEPRAANVIAKVMVNLYKFMID